jgi:hypothetical protein
MTQFAYRNWLFECDPSSTRTAYQQIAHGGAEECGCAGCRNFLAQRDEVFPEEVLKLFAELGVDWRRDAEIYHQAKLESGSHLYGGWFHFIGKIQKQPPGPTQIREGFTIDFIPARHLAAASFADEPLVQVEIAVGLPWIVKEEKEPD